MNVGSLFSGIGGLDLGLERAGMAVRWQSEIDPYASRVLAKHWPDIPNLGDITTIDWRQVEPVDLICGGYPCQPFSLAGVRRGTDDPRHLWPHMLRAVCELRPRFALLENVPGHLSMGFGRVLGDLAESGYRIEWDCIPAAAVGAPHRRDRVFGVAYDPTRVRRGRQTRPDRRVLGVVSDTERNKLRQQPVAIFGRSGTSVARDDGETRALADPDGTQVGRSRRPAHHGDHWAVEPDVGRVAHGVPSRVDRLRCLGNAVVPQVAEWIGHQIIQAAA